MTTNWSNGLIIYHNNKQRCVYGNSTRLHALFKPLKGYEQCFMNICVCALELMFYSLLYLRVLSIKITDICA